MTRTAAETLARRYELAHVDVTVADRSWRILRPKSMDELIDAEDFSIDERLPYWADVWPSARVLAQHMATDPMPDGQLLELGCGLGLVSLAAAGAGYEVLATDYYREALEFVAANAEENNIRTIDTRLVDWRQFPDDMGLFDRVIGSDVLYEKPYAELVSAAIAATLKPGGRAIITDPGRSIAGPFAAMCHKRKLDCRTLAKVPWKEWDTSLTVHVYEITWQGKR